MLFYFTKVKYNLIKSKYFLILFIIYLTLLIKVA